MMDKQKLIKWLENEIRSCNIVKHERDLVIRWECERIIERINAGLFDKEAEDGEPLVWKEAKEHLYVMKKAYEDIGFAGSFGLSMTIIPLVKRFEAGERTSELHEEIMGIA